MFIIDVPLQNLYTHVETERDRKEEQGHTTIIDIAAVSS